MSTAKEQEASLSMLMSIFLKLRHPGRNMVENALGNFAVYKCFLLL